MYARVAVMKLAVLVVLCAWMNDAAADTAARCPSGLPHTTAVRVFRDTCYQFVSEERHWTGARDYCIEVSLSLSLSVCVRLCVLLLLREARSPLLTSA